MVEQNGKEAASFQGDKEEQSKNVAAEDNNEAEERNDVEAPIMNGISQESGIVEEKKEASIVDNLVPEPQSTREDVPSMRSSMTSSAPSIPKSDRSSSLELRMLPVNVLLKPDDSAPDNASVLDSVDDDDEEKSEKAPRPGLLRMTCLNPKLYLRTQLMLSFGSVNFFTIAVVVVICVAVSLLAGENIKEINQETFESMGRVVQGRTARYLAESLEHQLIPTDMVNIIYEVTRDRFEGYPSDVDNDDRVPFTDMVTNTSKYPLVSTPIPLDWQIEDPVTLDNHEELIQGRRASYAADAHLSAANGAFIMQGACDPSVTDTFARSYWPNCTDANNNITTGGTIAPSNMTQHIHRKASDIVPVLKALYEFNQDVRDVGIYFANQGVGAGVNFPHYELDSQNTFVSNGCDWMREPNPYDPSRPIGTEEEIAKCQKEGTVLSSRLYNPLLRAWCRDQALHPDKVIVEGPYLDAWENNWHMSSGRAVYDRETNDFVACIFVGSTLDYVEDIVKQSRVTPNSEVSIVRFDPEGTVLASSAKSTSNSSKVFTIAELELGVADETYKDIYTMVDYSSHWESAQVKQAYEAFTAQADGFFVAVYPIPPVPDEYDTNYQPLFLSLVSSPEEDVYEKFQEVNQDVDENVNRAIMFAVIVGAAGFVFCTVIILITATAITKPLQQMNNTAENIVNTFGDDDTDMESSIEPVNRKFSRCTPNTEVSNVVEEFNKLVSGFSGSRLMARSERGKYVEMRNRFELFDLEPDFLTLYESRREESDLPYIVVEKKESSGQNEEPVSHDTVFHPGSNIKNSVRMGSKSLRISREQGKRKASPLFVWTVILIVTPLLVTTITLSAVVVSTVFQEFNDSVEDAKEHFVDFAISALGVYARLRAVFVSTHTSRSVRDLYLMTRYSSWLLFGGLNPSGSFSKTWTAANACLDAENAGVCPYALENRVCDCAWNYAGEECVEYPEGSRDLQVPYFLIQSDNALLNGTRLKTDFPNNSVTPDTTLWWDGPFDLPGLDQNESSMRYATSYSRLWTISAFPLFPVLNNYDIEKENGRGHFFAFEDDGLFWVNEGCGNSDHARWAPFWRSSEENGAATFRPELCPINKYGYDPRCREWYHKGKEKALMDGNPFHLTAPYRFAESAVGQSATSSLIDPATGYHVGQSLIDFEVTPIFGVLSSSSTPLTRGGFPLLITVETDSFGGDTVIGPGLNGTGEAAQPVPEVVVAVEHGCASRGDQSECKDRYVRFEQIVKSMKAGNISIERFDRTAEDGGTETVYIAYAPVVTNYPYPANASDFTRGAFVDKHLIYSLGLAETEEGIVESFSEIEDEMQKQINMAIGILAAVIFLAVLASIYVCYVVARSISEPMSYLLEVIRSLNRVEAEEDFQTTDKSIGSKEIVNVQDTMESLSRVVRLANVSFYAGDLEAAYRVFADALRLFKRLDNKKAIGVASNNLGNTCLAMYLEMKREKLASKYGVTRQEIISKATCYFHDAIQLGEKSYEAFNETEGWTPACLDFMQHLSNRYFNRAIFLLTIKDDHEHPSEIESLGFQDLTIARDMDLEIVDQGEEVGWGRVKRAEKLFEVRLVRVRGHLMLLEMGYPDRWEVDEILDALFNSIAEESRKPSSDLFTEMTYIGRIQEAETEMMKYLIVKGEILAAARIAVRALYEDEFIFLDTNAQAIEALKAYVDLSDSDFDEDSRERLKESLEDVLDSLSRDADSASTKQTQPSSRGHRILSKSMGTLQTIMESQPSSSTWSITERSGKFVTMEQF